MSYIILNKCYIIYISMCKGTKAGGLWFGEISDFVEIKM
jgi:hypothetical protein